MLCPQCGSDGRKNVKETRTAADGRIVRRRHCPACKVDFQTIEQLNVANVRVRKSDGRLVPFNRSTLLRAITKASVPSHHLGRMNEVIDAVVTDAHTNARNGEISSVEIGELVMRHLREFDQMSHIRYALVQVGRLDNKDGSPADGWRDIAEVRRWLLEQYPQLQYHRPPAKLEHVVKRDGRRESFERTKLERAVGIVSKGRGNSSDDVHAFASNVAKQVIQQLGDQPLVTSGQIATEIMNVLRREDPIAYLRFASTAKSYVSAEDYESEAVALWMKKQ